MTLPRTQFLLSLAAMLIAAVVSVGADRVDADKPGSAKTTGAPAKTQATGRAVSHATVSRPVSPTPAQELMQDAPAASSTLSTGRPARSVWMEVTAYCPCTKCCGPNAIGVTASGLPVSHNAGRFVAADTSVLPFGSQIRIPGYHNASPVPVIDRGGAIRGQKLDVFFPTHDEALQWGRQWVMVAVAE